MDRKDYPLIGVVPSYQLDEDALIIPNRYMNALAQSCTIPLVVPLASSSAIQEALLPNFDGFLLSGGQDIDPRRYGESVTGAHLSEFCSQREETEHLILDFAKRYDARARHLPRYASHECFMRRHAVPRHRRRALKDDLCECFCLRYVPPLCRTSPNSCYFADSYG